MKQVDIVALAFFSREPGSEAAGRDMPSNRINKFANQCMAGNGTMADCKVSNKCMTVSSCLSWKGWF